MCTQVIDYVAVSFQNDWKGLMGCLRDTHQEYHKCRMSSTFPFLGYIILDVLMGKKQKDRLGTTLKIVYIIKVPILSVTKAAKKKAATKKLVKGVGVTHQCVAV